MSTLQEIDHLERKITAAISQISAGKTSPQASRIGSLLGRLKKLDKASYEKHVISYKPVFRQWKDDQDLLLKKKANEAEEVSDDMLDKEEKSEE